MSRDIEARIELFLEGWNRSDWMVEHGEWASTEWDNARAEYDKAIDALEYAINTVPSAYSANSDALSEIRYALEAAEEALDELEGQVKPDESDYIIEGVIDPDNVEGLAEQVGVSSSWEGWCCKEGWVALRTSDDLYLNWYRHAYGNRRSRDLYVLVEGDFFASEEE